MKCPRIYGAILLLVLLTMAGLNTEVRAAEQVCYECTAKLCFDEFTTAAGAIDQQFEQEKAEVVRHLSEMQLAAAKKAEVLGATEAVLRGNASQRKLLVFDGLGECLAAN